MNRRGFLRALGGAVATLAVVPRALIEGAVGAVTPAPIVPLSPWLRGEFGVWTGVVWHETAAISGISEHRLGPRP